MLRACLYLLFECFYDKELNGMNKNFEKSIKLNIYA